MGLGTSMPCRAYADKLSVSDWYGPASQLCTHNASAVGSTSHTHLFSASRVLADYFRSLPHHDLRRDYPEYLRPYPEDH
jgi:hypothetical protein